MKEIVKKIVSQTLATHTGKNSLLTIIAIGINTIFSAGFFIILARGLGPSQLGLFSVALALMLTATGFADWGTNYGILRFVPGTKDPRSFLKLGLLAKIGFGLVATLIVGFSSNLLATSLFHKPELTPLFVVSSLGILGGLLYGYGLNTTQALQKFIAWSGLQIGPSLLRLLLLVALLFLGLLNPQSALLAYMAMLFAVFLGCLPFLPKNMMKAAITHDTLSKFFSYNKWMALYTALLTLTGNVDRFFLARFSTASQVGYYVAALQIAGVGIQVQVALGTVLIPRFASISSRSGVISYLKKTALLTSSLAFGGVLVALIAQPLTSIIFGQAFLPSVAPLRILIVSVALFLSSLPFTSVWLYTLGKARDFSLFFLLVSTLIFVLNWLLVPSLGAVGSAIASLSGNALTLFGSIIYVKTHLNLIKA